jgi:hypothetical protein
MIVTELNEIKDYWHKKYPHVDVNLWINEGSGKYFGMMRGRTTSIDLSADTIGDLISQGEAYLRKSNEV